MDLYKFQSQVGTQDAQAIRARQLDENFSRLQPQSNGTYGINETANGWSLNIFPTYPQTATQALYLAYTGGSLQWRSISSGAISPGSLPGTVISPGTLSPSAISPGANGSLLITENNVATWSIAPPSGIPAWRQVERCDGKTMYVWGTAWAD